MTIQPMYTQVLVKPIEAKAQSRGGILLPGKADETTRAVVLAVGQGRRGKDGTLIPLLIEAGATVLIDSGKFIRVDGEEMILIKEDDILAIAK